MNIYTISMLLACIFNFIIGIFVYTRNPYAKLNRFFAVYYIALTMWVFGCFMESSITNARYAVFWDKVLYTGCILAAPLYLHFCYIITETKNKSYLLRLAYCTAYIWLIFNYSTLRPYFIREVIHKYWYRFIAIPGYLWYVYMLWFNFLILEMFITLFRNFNNASGFRRVQAKYLLIAFLIMITAGSFYFLLLLNISSPPIDPYLLIVFGTIMTYAIVRYRLMEIEVIIRKAIVFAGIFGFVFFVFGSIASLSQLYLANIIRSKFLATAISVVLITIFYEPLKKKLINLTDRFLFQKKYDYQKVLKDASRGMVNITNLNRLLDLIVHIVSLKIRLTNACIYLLDNKINQYIPKAVRFKVKSDMPKIIDLKDPLIVVLMNSRLPLVYDELKIQIQHEPKIYRRESMARIVTQMRELNASLIIPSFSEQALVGFLILGEKLSKDIYTQEDLDVLQVLSNQAALAIENAQFYEEVKRTQEQLFQAEKMATIGTMADGLSHQINNRFNALGLIAADTVDTLNMLDKNNLNSECQTTLGQIKNVLNRIEDNVKSGGEIVKGLLKYSRPGQEGFEPISLDTIIDSALEMAQYKVKLNEIEIRRNYDKNLPKIKVNLTQLQEVFFNLIDNAYFATKQRKEELKEESYKGCIDFSARVLDGKCQIKVSDNGIGVKKEDFNKLFTPFFTTKATANKGTGLGLFVIKKIISDNHKGNISVESTYKQGTTFIIELPLFTS